MHDGRRQEEVESQKRDRKGWSHKGESKERGGATKGGEGSRLKTLADSLQIASSVWYF